MPTTGDPAPDFELPSTNGDTVRLSDVLTEGPAVLVFFRGTWCSYCAEQLRTFSALAYDLKRHLDVSVLPITGDALSDLVEMRDLYDLRLQLLSDADLAVSTSYTEVEDNAKHGRIPVPATYVVDEEAQVRYVDVGTRPDDRTYANYVRSFVRDGYVDPYPGTFPDPYTE